jgi:signal transduction histidine kinase
MTRVNWQMKAVIPVAAVLLGGVLVFIWVTVPVESSARQEVIVVAAGGAIAICTVMLTVLAILIQRPLVELQQKIAQVREGDLSAEVSFAGRTDEIGQLGNDFNDMVRQLRESRMEIERLHQTQMSRAEHLATLGELAAGLAHEIRNPLAGIVGVLDIVARDLPGSSPATEVLREAQEETLRISKILSELLEYARPKPPDFQVVDINQTAEHAVVLARQQVASKPIQIDFVRLAGVQLVRHDSARMQQVLLNLLLNAIQAIAPGTASGREGHIELRLEAIPQAILLKVSDNGSGIKPEHLANVFRPFFTTKGTGTGLGLSLARSIVELHGGKISVESTRGQGTTFALTLPNS